jgi:predicted MFS family arabinose efflux permease
LFDTRDAAIGAPTPVSGKLANAGHTDAQVRFALAILLIIFSLNFLDRQIVTILAEDIRRDLHLDDWQIGVMSGLAFALFYTVLGIPIARMADRGDRVTILSVSLFVWSGFTALCGLATNFVTLLLARIGVGVGEAGCTPAAHSLIADWVRPERRASALAFYGLGIPIGSLLGMVMGGLIADAWGWRAAFFVAGLPGVALAVATWILLRDPRRVTGFPARATTAGTGFAAAVTALSRDRAYVLLAAGAAGAAFVGYGMGAFTPAYFIRFHGLSAGETGIWLGISSGVGGLIGTWLGGVLADRFGARDPAMFLLVPAIGMTVASVTFTPGLLAADWRWALVLIWIPGILNSLWYGPAFAVVQRLVAPGMRAMAAAIMLFVINIVGLGLGPLVLGAISDLMREVRFEALAPGRGGFEAVCGRGVATAGEAVCGLARGQGLQASLIVAVHLGLISAFFFWRASRHLTHAAPREGGDKGETP